MLITTLAYSVFNIQDGVSLKRNPLLTMKEKSSVSRHAFLLRKNFTHTSTCRFRLKKIILKIKQSYWFCVFNNEYL